MNAWQIHPDQMTDATSGMIDDRDEAQLVFDESKGEERALSKRRSELKQHKLSLAEAQDTVATAVLDRTKPKLGALHEVEQTIKIIELGLQRAQRLAPVRKLACLEGEIQLLTKEFELQEAVALAERDQAFADIESISGELGAGSGVQIENGKWDLRRQAALEMMGRAAQLNAEAELLKILIKQEESNNDV
jgi:hypothetical protein